MADFEQRDNSGALFMNKRKTKDSHPDRQGSVMVDGKQYWIAGWIKKTKDGDPWLSLSFTAKEEREESSRPSRSSRPADDDFDRDVPF